MDTSTSLAALCDDFGDSSAMVAARAQFLSAGHYAPLAEAVVRMAGVYAPSRGLLLEVGAGTGYHLARCLDGLAGRLGLAVDASKYAASRAARAHPRMDAVVADVWNAIPIVSGSVALALDVFAPRNAAELDRTLRRDGALLVVTPQSSHLSGPDNRIAQAFGAVQVDPRKEQRLARALGRYFYCHEKCALTWQMILDRTDQVALAGMLPSARHHDPSELAESIAMLPARLEIQGAATLHIYRKHAYLRAR